MPPRRASQHRGQWEIRLRDSHQHSAMAATSSGNSWSSAHWRCISTGVACSSRVWSEQLRQAVLISACVGAGRNHAWRPAGYRGPGACAAPWRATARGGGWRRPGSGPTPANRARLRKRWAALLHPVGECGERIEVIETASASTVGHVRHQARDSVFIGSRTSPAHRTGGVHRRSSNFRC